MIIIGAGPVGENLADRLNPPIAGGRWRNHVSLAGGLLPCAVSCNCRSSRSRAHFVGFGVVGWAQRPPGFRIVLNIPAADPALSTGTVLTAALSITEKATPTPMPKSRWGPAENHLVKTMPAPGRPGPGSAAQRIPHRHQPAPAGTTRKP